MLAKADKDNSASPWLKCASGQKQPYPDRSSKSPTIGKADPRSADLRAEAYSRKADLAKWLQLDNVPASVAIECRYTGPLAADRGR